VPYERSAPLGTRGNVSAAIGGVPKQGDISVRNAVILTVFLGLLVPPAAFAADEQTYSQKEIVHQVDQFFGHGAEDLAKVVQKVFADYGEPNAYVAGEEAGGAIVVGVRYGRGTLHMKKGAARKLYWQGPSIGLDFGASASKVFVLVYHLRDPEELFQRYPGVEGSLYFVGGVGVNYLQSGDVIIAPIRFGAGWRQGLSVGYMDFTREPSANPF
jgi:hypothetical protein